MRRKLIGVFVLAGLAGILLIPTIGFRRADGQAGGKQVAGKQSGAVAQPGDPNGPGGAQGARIRGGGTNGGGAWAGGFGGAGGGANFAIDPDKIFDTIAKGADAIVIANVTGFFQGMLTQFAQENGITNGRITRQQFSSFGQSMMEKVKAGGLGALGGGNNFDPDQAAARIFQYADKNGRGNLTEAEMPGNLKEVWRTYDKNGDGMINLEEYKTFFRDMIEARLGGNAGFGTPTIVVEDGWDNRPVVFRAGKLPAGLPAWFAQCDKDNDGQVALSEWRQNSGGRTIAEFQQMDRNGDGLLTAEEVLWYMKQLSNFGGGTLSEKDSVAQNPGFNNSPFGANGFKGGKKGGAGGQGGGGGGFGGNPRAAGDPAAKWGGGNGFGGGGGFGGNPKAGVDPAANWGGRNGGGNGFGGGGGFGGNPKAGVDPAANWGGRNGGGNGFGGGGGFSGDPKAAPDPAAIGGGRNGGRKGGG